MPLTIQTRPDVGSSSDATDYRLVWYRPLVALTLHVIILSAVTTILLLAVADIVPWWIAR